MVAAPLPLALACQAAIGQKIVASSAISPIRKDVLAKCYGGDISRKKKLLNKQANAVYLGYLTYLTCYTPHQLLCCFTLYSVLYYTLYYTILLLYTILTASSPRT